MDPTLEAGEGDSDFSPLVLVGVELAMGTVTGLSERGLDRLPGPDTFPSATRGFSGSSFRKLDFNSLVLSATDGGFSGRGGAGPLLDPWWVVPVDISRQNWFPQWNTTLAKKKLRKANTFTRKLYMYSNTNYFWLHTKYTSQTHEASRAALTNDVFHYTTQQS